MAVSQKRQAQALNMQAREASWLSHSAAPVGLLLLAGVPLAPLVSPSPFAAPGLVVLAIALLVVGARPLRRAGEVPLIAPAVFHEAAFGAGLILVVTAVAWTVGASCQFRPDLGDTDVTMYAADSLNNARYALSAAALASAALALAPFLLTFGASQFLSGRFGEVIALMQVRSRLHLWCLSASLASLVICIGLLASVTADPALPAGYTALALVTAGALACVLVGRTVRGRYRWRAALGLCLLPVAVGLGATLGAPLLAGLTANPGLPSWATGAIGALTRAGLDGIPETCWWTAAPTAAAAAILVQALLLLASAANVLPRSWRPAHHATTRIRAVAHAAAHEFGPVAHRVEGAWLATEAARSACEALSASGTPAAAAGLARGLLEAPEAFAAPLLRVWALSEGQADHDDDAHGLLFGLTDAIGALIAARVQLIASEHSRSTSAWTSFLGAATSTLLQAAAELPEDDARRGHIQDAVARLLGSVAACENQHDGLATEGDAPASARLITDDWVPEVRGCLGRWSAGAPSVCGLLERAIGAAAGDPTRGWYWHCAGLLAVAETPEVEPASAARAVYWAARDMRANQARWLMDTYVVPAWGHAPAEEPYPRLVGEMLAALWRAPCGGLGWAGDALSGFVRARAEAGEGLSFLEDMCLSPRDVEPGVVALPERRVVLGAIIHWRAVWVRALPTAVSAPTLAAIAEVAPNVTAGWGLCAETGVRVWGEDWLYPGVRPPDEQDELLATFERMNAVVREYLRLANGTLSAATPPRSPSQGSPPPVRIVPRSRPAAV